MISKNKFIPYGKQSISDEDIRSVVDALKKTYITQGPLCNEFESMVSEKLGSNHSLAVNSATSALHLACRALGLKNGDLLWTTPITFVASANCALYCGAKVDFVDIDPKTGHISIKALKIKLQNAFKNHKLPKILIPVHLTGSSCDMEEIHRLSKQYKFKIIEDASHALGGKYKNEYIGNCKYSSICVFSFHPVKIITTGEGGLATTNDKKLHQKMERLRSHGITKNKMEFIKEAEGPWSYEQQDLGYNYRMNEIQAALGISQLKRLDQFVSKRNSLFENYLKLLKNQPITMLEIPSDCYSSIHLAVIRLNNQDKKFHKKIFEQMRTHNIGVQLHYQPIHLQPYFKELGFMEGDFPNSELYGHNAISIPLFPELTDEEQKKVVELLTKLLSEN